MKTRKIKKVFLSMLLIFVSFNFITQNTKASEIVPVKLSVDFDTGIIFKREGDIDKKTPIASVSKMLPHYIFLEKIQKGELNGEKKIIIKKDISILSKLPDLSNVPLNEGREYTVNELLEASMVVSANAATVALAVEVAGSEKQFLELIKVKAEELGLSNYEYINVTGLPNKLMNDELKNSDQNGDAENQISARSLAKLAIKLYSNINIPQLNNYEKEEIKFVTSAEEEAKFPNTNKMLPGKTYEYAGVKGIKTGTSDSAGYNLVTFAKINDELKQVGVVLNTKDDIQRYTEMTNTLNYKIRNEKYETVIIDKDETEYDNIPINHSYQIETTGKFTKTYSYLILNEEDKKNIKYKFSSLEGKDFIQGNYKTGDKIGYLVIEENETIAFLDKEYRDKYKIEIIATENITEKNKFDDFSDAVGSFFEKIKNIFR
jgi:D-alanyl-D-alanine carboxypeptidase (penicillin-binding protein 5/6)